MTAVADLMVLLSANTAGLTAGLAKGEGELGAFGAKGATTAGDRFAKMGKAVTLGVAAAGAGIMYEAARQATSFQKNMEMVRTQAGASQGEVTRMSGALKEMSGAVGQGPAALAQSLYHVESAGFRGAKALAMVKDAAKLVGIGGGDIQSTTKAIIALTASGIKGLHGTAGAAAYLNAVVGSGDMRMADLTSAMSTGIMSTAKVYGLGARDVGAALATMTDNSMGADSAATRLRMTMSLMGAPTQAAQAALESIGLTGTQLAQDMRKPNGLLVALEDLKKHLNRPMDQQQFQNGIAAGEKSLLKMGLTAAQVRKMVTSAPSAVARADILGRAFGGGRTSSAIMLLLTQLDRVKSKYAAIASGTRKFGSDWAATTKTEAFQMAQLHAELDTILVTIGTALLPVIHSVIAGVEAMVLWFTKHRTAALALAAAVGAILVPLMAAYAVQQTKAAAAHIAQLGKDIAKVGVWVAAHVTGNTTVSASTEAQAATAETASTTQVGALERTNVALEQTSAQWQGLGAAVTESTVTQTGEIEAAAATQSATVDAAAGDQAAAVAAGNAAQIVDTETSNVARLTSIIATNAAILTDTLATAGAASMAWLGVLGPIALVAGAGAAIGFGIHNLISGNGDGGQASLNAAARGTRQDLVKGMTHGGGYTEAGAMHATRNRMAIAKELQAHGVSHSDAWKVATQIEQNTARAAEQLKLRRSEAKIHAQIAKTQRQAHLQQQKANQQGASARRASSMISALSNVLAGGSSTTRTAGAVQAAIAAVSAYSSAHPGATSAQLGAVKRQAEETYYRTHGAAAKAASLQLQGLTVATKHATASLTAGATAAALQAMESYKAAHASATSAELRRVRLQAELHFYQQHGDAVKANAVQMELLTAATKKTISASQLHHDELMAMTQQYKADVAAWRPSGPLAQFWAGAQAGNAKTGGVNSVAVRALAGEAGRGTRIVANYTIHVGGAGDAQLAKHTRRAVEEAHRQLAHELDRRRPVH